MDRREVWITGLGAETAAGSGAPRLGEAVAAGAGFVRPHPDLDGFPAGWIETPPAGREVRRLDRSAALFLTAAEEAWQGAGLGGEVRIDPARVAVLEGSSLGPVVAVLEARDGHAGARLDLDGTAGGEWPTAAGARPPRSSPAFLVRLMTGAGGAAFAARHSIMGPVFHLSAGSVSAAAAIGEAFQKVATGSVDVALAGGAECPLHPEVLAVFGAAGVLAADSAGDGPACRPFDVRRNGTLLGEGAGVLILESEPHARRRGAAPLAVLAGYGVACEAGSMTAPDPAGSGVVGSVRQAMEDVWPDEVGWIKTHGTGTRLNDAAEYRGLAALFGERLCGIPLTSLKPALGHCLGACGAVETVAAVLAMNRGIVPRTLGTGMVDPEFAGCRVATEVESKPAETVLLLFESFGGRCAALVLGRA